MTVATDRFSGGQGEGFPGVWVRVQQACGGGEPHHSNSKPPQRGLTQDRPHRGSLSCVGFPASDD